MGIKDLWTILQPYCERKPLFELQGKRVAIDLSGWVCQAQCITEYHVQPKMYLRNLFFRTCFLLLQDVQMVFVLEGKAPTLKYKTIAARNEMQFKGAAPRPQRQSNKADSDSNKDRGNKGRSRFDHTLAQCEQMLKLMGLVCVTGKGEAEAMCAHLNKNKLIQGCISQDSDCFAYGAEIVYRNFSISTRGNQPSCGGSIDVYDLGKSLQEMDFGRNKVIALALICGSDYNEGVFGVGKESALKFFATISEKKILDEIRSWRTNKSHFARLDKLLNDPKKCAACGHNGKKASHARSGCLQCSTRKGCEINKEQANLRLCLQLRAKALQDAAFPDEELIREFLQEREVISKLDLSWKMPDLPGFIDFTRRHLQWEEIYAFEKLFPILTRWLVNNPHARNAITSPEIIKKKRAPKGIASYEILWRKDQLSSLIPPEQITDENKLFSSIEEQSLVDKAFPDLVRVFEESKLKPTKAKKKKTAKTKKITDYINANDSLFDDVNDDYNQDLSLVVENICNRGVPTIFKQKINEIIREAKQIESSFFDLNMDEAQVDAFEQTVFVSLSSDDEDDECD